MIKMFALLTDQETAAAESALCEICKASEPNVLFAREMASQAGDVDETKEFVDCTENDALTCCNCGYPDLIHPLLTVRE